MQTWLHLIRSARNCLQAIYKYLPVSQHNAAAYNPASTLLRTTGSCGLPPSSSAVPRHSAHLLARPPDSRSLCASLSTPTHSATNALGPPPLNHVCSRAHLRRQPPILPPQGLVQPIFPAHKSRAGTFAWHPDSPMPCPRPCRCLPCCRRSTRRHSHPSPSPRPLAPSLLITARWRAGG